MALPTNETSLSTSNASLCVQPKLTEDRGWGQWSQLVAQSQRKGPTLPSDATNLQNKDTEYSPMPGQIEDCEVGEQPQPHSSLHIGKCNSSLADQQSVTEEVQLRQCPGSEVEYESSAQTVHENNSEGSVDFESAQGNLREEAAENDDYLPPQHEQSHADTSTVPQTPSSLTPIKVSKESKKVAKARKAGNASDKKKCIVS